MSQSLLFQTGAKIAEIERIKALEGFSVIELIKQFETEPRFIHFLEDLEFSVNNQYGSTLGEAERLKASAICLDDLIEKLTEIKRNAILKSDLIIEDKVRAGVFEEGEFKLEPVEKKSNRTLDLTLLKKTYPKQFEEMLETKKEQIQSSYSPTQTEIKAKFGKGWDALYRPGDVEIIGYNVVLSNPVMPIKAAEVEL